MSIGGVQESKFLARSQVSYRSLEGSIDADVAVIGAGIAALSAALELHRAGQKVVILSPTSILGPTDSMPEGFFNLPEPATHARWLEDFGLSTATQLAFEHGDALQQLQARSTGSSDRFYEEIPLFHVAENAEQLGNIERDCAAGKALRRETWFSRDIDLPFACAGATREPNHGRMNEGAFVRLLASEFVMLGGTIYENSPCVAPPIFGKPCNVKTEKGEVTAASLLLGVRVPHPAMSALVSQLTPYHSYYLAAQIDQHLGEGAYVLNDQPRRRFWRANRFDESKVVFRLDQQGEETGRQNLHLEELACYAAKRFSIKKVLTKWSEHHLMAPDHLPLLGRLAEMENVFWLGGMGGQELPWGLPCGKAMAQLVTGETPPLAKLLDASRLLRTAEGGISPRHPTVYSPAIESQPAVAPTPTGKDRRKPQMNAMDRRITLDFPNLVPARAPGIVASFHRYVSRGQWRRS